MEEKDIKLLMQEEDGQELFQMACEVKSALVPLDAQPDVDAEWQRFSAAHQIHNRRIAWRKYAAVAASIVLVCGIGIAAVLPALRSAKDEDRGAQPSAAAETTVQQAQQPAQDAFVFQQATLEEILLQLADYYQAEVKFTDAQARNIQLHIQLDKSLSLPQAVEFLNHFEKVKLRMADSHTVIVE